MDWGIAVALEDDGSGRIPLAREQRSPAGTPAYMAPEMLGAGELSVRTDVYLLGAILYELVVGHPPHPGEALVEVFANVLERTPPLPPTVPVELRAICARALERDPAARFDDVTSFRRAIVEFLDHRASVELARQADRRVAQLLDRLERARADVDESVLLYNLFGACRFGFRQALESWPENPQARHGIEVATRAMIEYELGQKNARAAGLLLAELDSPSDALREKVRAASAVEDRQRAELERLRALGHDLDPSVGRGRRVATGLALGVVWSVGPATLGLVQGWLPWLRTQWTVIGGSLGVALLALTLWRIGRPILERTAINRRLAAAVFLALALQTVMFLAHWAGGLDHRWSEAMLPLVWATVLALVASNIESRLWPSVLVNLIAFGIASTSLDWRHAAASAAMLALTVNVVAIWRGGPSEPPPERATVDDAARPTLAPDPPSETGRRG